MSSVRVWFSFLRASIPSSSSRAGAGAARTNRSYALTGTWAAVVEHNSGLGGGGIGRRGALQEWRSGGKRQRQKLSQRGFFFFFYRDAQRAGSQKIKIQRSFLCRHCFASYHRVAHACSVCGHDLFSTWIQFCCDCLPPTVSPCHSQLYIECRASGARTRS